MSTLYVYCALFQNFLLLLFISILGSKKRKKHKKKSKRRHDSVSSKSSDSDQPKVKALKLNVDCPEIARHDDLKTLDTSEKDSANDVTKLDEYLNANKETETMDKVVDGSGSPQLPPLMKKLDDEFDEPVISKLLGLYLPTGVGSFYY